MAEERHCLADGFYDEGDWVTWEEIAYQIEEQAARDSVIKTNPPRGAKLLAMIEQARAHYRATRERSHLLGEIGELYAEEQFGITRHKPGTQGSDGKIGDNFVEIKTITPGKKHKLVRVKRAGNFNKLVVVRIWGNYRMEARMIDRQRLPKGPGSHAFIYWDDADYRPVEEEILDESEDEPTV